MYRVLPYSEVNAEMGGRFFVFTKCYSDLRGLFLQNVLTDHETLCTRVNCTLGKIQLGLFYHIHWCLSA